MVHVCVCVCAVVIVQLCLCVSFSCRPSHFSQVGVCCILLKKRARIVKDRAVALPRALPPRARHVSFNLLEIFFWGKKKSFNAVLFCFCFLESVICLLRVCLGRKMYKDACVEACEKC